MLVCRLTTRDVVLAAVIASATASSVLAAEIDFVGAGALQWWAEDLIPDFQRTTPHTVKSTFQVISVIADRVDRGDAVDLATIADGQWEALEKGNKIDPAVRTVIAKVGYGVFVRKGAAKPDISSVEALKRAFLNARSFASFDPNGRGPTVPYVASVFERLGISSEMNAKTKYAGRAKPNQPSSAPIFELVAKGDAELGVAVTSEILHAWGVELIGLIPAELQSLIVYTAVIPRQAREPIAARALVDFLTSPTAASRLKASGLIEP